jgi:hypothetical protein
MAPRPLWHGHYSFWAAICTGVAGRLQSPAIDESADASRTANPFAATSLEVTAMAEKTEELMKGCEDALKQVDEWVKSAETARKTLDGSVKRFEATVKDPEVEKWTADNQTVATEKLFYQNAINMIQLRVTAAEKAAKALDSKVSLKKVLDFFKTQKSLDKAKGVLKDTQEKIKDAKGEKAKHDKEMKSLEKRIESANGLQTQMVSLREQLLPIIKGAIKKVTEGILKVKKNPTLGEWEASLKQPIRALTAGLGKSVPHKSFVAAWGNVSKDDFIRGTEEGEPVQEKANEIQGMLMVLIPKVK